jgi:hypothetical protein
MPKPTRRQKNVQDITPFPNLMRMMFIHPTQARHVFQTSSQSHRQQHRNQTKTNYFWSVCKLLQLLISHNYIHTRRRRKHHVLIKVFVFSKIKKNQRNLH